MAKRWSGLWLKLLLAFIKAKRVPISGEARAVSAVFPVPRWMPWVRWQQPERGFPSDERLTIVFGAACDEASKRDAEAVGGEHLIWSVFTQARGRFLEVLEEVLGDLSPVLARLDARLGEGKVGRVGRLPQTPELLTLVDKAMEERKKRGLGVTVPALLLLVMCQDTSSGAAALLVDLGVDLDRLAEGMNSYLNGIRST